MANRFKVAWQALFKGIDLPSLAKLGAEVADDFEGDGSWRREPLDNPTVLACLRYLANAMALAEPEVRRKDTDAVVEGHPLAELLRSPQGGVTHSLFLGQLVESFFGAGNALYAVDLVGGEPAELRFIPWGRVDCQNGIYRYTAANGLGTVSLPAERVLHLRYRLDADTGKGVSPFRGLARRELELDGEALRHMTLLLRNMGVPGWLIGPPDDGEAADPEEFTNIVRTIDSYNQGRKGKALAVNGRFKIQALEYGLARVGVENVRKAPRAAICSVLGVPPRLALVDGGGPATMWGNTLQEERLEAFEHTVVPTLVNIGEQITSQVLHRWYDPERTTYLVYRSPDLVVDESAPDPQDEQMEEEQTPPAEEE